MHRDRATTAAHPGRIALILAAPASGQAGLDKAQSTDQTSRGHRPNNEWEASMTSSRRKFIQLSLGAAALSAMAGAARAQPGPSRTISIVVFLPAGAIPDIIARLVGNALSQRLGQPI